MGIENIIIDNIEKEKDVFINASHRISDNPELQNQEFFASDLLSTLLFERGFSIKKDIAGHKTGFVAKKCSGKPGPTIAFLAEYDALPDIGHGCGHNVIGALSCLAAVGLASVMDKTVGSVLVFGTPAEEGGDGGSAKASYSDNGLFDDVDVAMLLHPSCENALTRPMLAVRCYSFEFFGKTAHAAGCPELGINALDSMILFYNGINALRQQCATDVRIHGVITNGGTAPNVIPDYTKAKFYIRGKSKKQTDETLKRVIKIAEGAAIATGCTYKVEKFNNDVDDIVINHTFDILFKENAEKFGLYYEHPNEKPNGSSDVGNVSYVIPVIQPTLKVSDEKIPGHTVEFRDACVSGKADKALNDGAKALAITGFSILTDMEKLSEIKAAHAQLLKEE